MSSPVWHPFTQHGLGEEIPTIVESEGAIMRAADGRAFIDAISSWWVTTHGHRHPRIMEAIASQTKTLDQIIFAGLTHEPAEAVAQALIALLPDPLRHVFFSDSGSTSVEVALKMALGYWLHTGRPRHRIIVLDHGYHGDTIGGMSVGARGVYNRAYSPLLFDVDSLPFPAAGCEQQTLDRLDTLCRTGEAAALIVEPLLLGAGGMLIYSPEVLAEMRAICARHDVLFIADEVMTGWGRTGTLFACEQAGIAPDIICLSKGLTGGAIPLAVTVASPRIYEAHRSADRSRMFFHSSSYTANPIACAAALANLQIWQEEPVLERVAALAAVQSEMLDTMASLSGVHNARRIGTVTAMEIGHSDKDYLAEAAPQLGAFFRERGVFLRPMGNTVYVMPPYCITREQLEQVYGAIREAAFSRSSHSRGNGRA